MTMKLHFHPASTTSRPVALFAADHRIELEYQLVDLFAGEHVQPAFSAINPNQAVPVLDDGDFRLTESSAILKYLAEKAGSPAYPRDLRQRSRVNERMDWFNNRAHHGRRSCSCGLLSLAECRELDRPDEGPADVGAGERRVLQVSRAALRPVAIRGALTS